MRIAFYAPMKPPDDPVPSGDGRMARLFMAALSRAGATVDLASHLRAYDGAGDPVRRKRLAAAGKREARGLLDRYRRSGPRETPDLWFTYHLYHKAPDDLGPVVARALGIPYVVAEASHAPKQAAGRWAEGYRAAEGAIRAADRIYCLNPVDRACLEPLVRADVLRDMPPFIDTAPFRVEGAERAAARAALPGRFGFEPSAATVLAVAMMRPDQKLRSYAVLAEALRMLGDRPWNALFVGGGPAEAEVRRLAAPLGSRVALAGPLGGRDLKAAYAGADIYAWPSVKEAFGLSFIEAAAAGLCIVAGRSGGIAHIVEEGRTGLVVPAGDAVALAAGLAALLADRDRARRMGEAGAARARTVNDVEAASRLLRADLPSLISRQTKSASADA